VSFDCSAASLYLQRRLSSYGILAHIPKKPAVEYYRAFIMRCDIGSCKASAFTAAIDAEDGSSTGT
jgi:hypothetical protein